MNSVEITFKDLVDNISKTREALMLLEQQQEFFSNKLFDMYPGSREALDIFIKENTNTNYHIEFETDANIYEGQNFFCIYLSWWEGDGIQYGFEIYWEDGKWVICK